MSKSEESREKKYTLIKNERSERPKKLEILFPEFYSLCCKIRGSYHSIRGHKKRQVCLKCRKTTVEDGAHLCGSCKITNSKIRMNLNKYTLNFDRNGTRYAITD